MKRVTWEDEWLAEAYMTKDWTELTKKDFQNTIDLYLSYIIRKGYIKESDKKWMNNYIESLHADYSVDPQKRTNHNINISEWRNFQIGKMFTIYPTKDYKGMSTTDLDDGGTTPVIANSAMNNGINGFSTLEPTEQGKIITFSDTTEGNTFFYQPEPFIGFAHVQGMHEYGGHHWTEKQLLFLTTILTFANCDLFNYGRKMRRDTIANSIIKLPAQKKGNDYILDENKTYSVDGYIPDWGYMENYIKTLPYSDRV